MQDLHFIPNFITLLGVLDCQATMSRSQLLVWCFSWLSCFWGGMRAISSEFHQKIGRIPTTNTTNIHYLHIHIDWIYPPPRMLAASTRIT